MLTPQRRARIDQVVEARQRGCVVLEDVYDPGNIAAVMRTCEAFGFQNVALVFDRQVPFDPRKFGADISTAANKWLDFEVHRSSEECLDRLEATGHEVIATIPGEDADSIFEVDLTCELPAVWIGNEHTGLSEPALARARRRVSVPLVGMVQSLNLSVTAGILLYEITRQRAARGMDAYRLATEERSRLSRDFLQRAEDPRVVRARRTRSKRSPER
ncbi:MAG: RNA methyltransferase [Planctomycetes bacterium]|nr:RNA methyltransferase [Planctomycetota bacterium]